VALTAFDTPGHGVSLFYSGGWLYGVRCSCGYVRRYEAYRAQNLPLPQVLAWIAYRHTGKEGSLAWSSITSF
jgi:hypothetical protein